MRIVVLSLLIVFQLSTVIQAQDVPTLVYAESRLPYREHGDQIMPPTPSGEDKAETSEEKRLLNLLYATVICYSRFLGRGDNVPTASLCDVKIRQSLHGEKIYIELRLKPDIYWRQPITDPKKPDHQPGSTLHHRLFAQLEKQQTRKGSRRLFFRQRRDRHRRL